MHAQVMMQAHMAMTSAAHCTVAEPRGRRSRRRPCPSWWSAPACGQAELHARLAEVDEALALFQRRTVMVKADND